MTPVTLLRIASLLSLFYAAGHTLGAMQSWSPPGETEVFQAMRTFRFDAEGASRTYWDFYFGFGLIISVFLFAQAVVLWQLATLSRRDSMSFRPIVGVLFVSTVGNAVLAWKFFFALPMILAAAVAALLGLTLAVLRRSRPA